MFFCSFFIFGPITLFSFCEEMLTLQCTGICSACTNRLFVCHWGMWFDCINCSTKVDSYVYRNHAYKYCAVESVEVFYVIAYL